MHSDLSPDSDGRRLFENPLPGDRRLSKNQRALVRNKYE
jgi:hypothetical protein